jgi:hypothetical protein
MSKKKKEGECIHGTDIKEFYSRDIWPYSKDCSLLGDLVEEKNYKTIKIPFDVIKEMSKHFVFYGRKPRIYTKLTMPILKTEYNEFFKKVLNNKFGVRV